VLTLEAMPGNEHRTTAFTDQGKKGVPGYHSGIKRLIVASRVGRVQACRGPGRAATSRARSLSHNASREDVREAAYPHRLLTTQARTLPRLHCTVPSGSVANSYGIRPLSCNSEPNGYGEERCRSSSPLILPGGAAVRRPGRDGHGVCRPR
jgi:hypothetical protein